MDTSAPRHPAHAATLSPSWLMVAPHRGLFFIGAANVLMAMAWWTCWLADARFGWGHVRQPQPWAGWMHAVVMQYQVLPPFIFGFLLTVFTRWTGQRELQRWHYIPVGAGLLGGQAAVLAGLWLAQPAAVLVGVMMSLAGWAHGMVQLMRVLLGERHARRGPTWHAVSCFGAIVAGFIGLACVLAHLLGADGRWIVAGIKIGSFAVLLPVFITVAHRMFPFFAGNVVPGYVPWRPMGLLPLFWAGLLAHLGLELAHAPAWSWIADAPLALLSARVLWKWWPRGRAPGLLWVLFAGFAWLPVAFALYATQSLAWAIDGLAILGRGPAHAIYVGFFGSLLVAMVTRVTQGHSGQPLRMPAAGWFAFGAVQCAALVRILADSTADPALWQVVAGALWLLGFLPWVLRSAAIYLRPRSDGKPG